MKRKFLLNCRSPLIFKFFESNANILKFGYFNYKDTVSEYKCHATTYWGSSILSNARILQGGVFDIFAALYFIILHKCYCQMKKGKCTHKKSLFFISLFLKDLRFACVSCVFRS